MSTLLSKVSSRAGVLSVGLLLAACGDGSSGPNATAPFRLAFRVAPSTAAAGAALRADGAPDDASLEQTADGILITRGDDEILVNRLALVIRDIHLQSPATTCSSDDDSDDDSEALAGVTATTREDEDDEDEDGCPTVHAGPVFVEIPTSGANAQQLAVEIPEGTYSRIRMRLKAVKGNDSASRAFKTENPEAEGLSVLVEGVQDGKPFTFTTDVNAQLEVPLDEPLAIGDDGDQVTVSLNLANWFAAPRGGLYALDTEKANVRAHITNTIRDAFRAFRDRNRDGRKD